MINNLQSLISKVLYAPVSTPQSVGAQNTSNNPFANPFMQTTTNQYYGKNSPVKGGYFAGYYNNKPNIVGRRLFLEV
ncbi:MAG: hypothetical protein PHV37_03190 [Candidatus Gastranaerophilales bacterium]|nr:hypothetical protein [Candidatus Gastranaerophilales bacterium]